MLERMFFSSLVLLFSCCLAHSALTTSTTGRRAISGDVRNSASKTTLFLLTGYKPPVLGGPQPGPKTAEVEDEDDPLAMAELPPKPLPQTMLPKNVTEDALKPPLGAAHIPHQLVDVDICKYDSPCFRKVSA